MKAGAVNQLWFEALVDQRTAGRTRHAAAVEEGKRSGEAMVAWLQRVLPESCDEQGRPHVLFLGALSMLVYIHGRGNVRRDMVRERVRRAHPDAYADVYGADAVTTPVWRGRC